MRLAWQLSGCIYIDRHQISDVFQAQVVQFKSGLTRHRRGRSRMYASLLAFIVTGIYLMLADPNYLGVGNFSNPWSILMLVKRLVVMAMLALGFWFNAILRLGHQMSTNTGAALALKRFRLYTTP
jgi:ABC-type thiamin/hydroxymethylpyrimidine transport system permease subunit